jgi:hypothetical protein
LDWLPYSDMILKMIKKKQFSILAKVQFDFMRKMESKKNKQNKIMIQFERYWPWSDLVWLGAQENDDCRQKKQPSICQGNLSDNAGL